MLHFTYLTFPTLVCRLYIPTSSLVLLIIFLIYYHDRWFHFRMVGLRPNINQPRLTIVRFLNGWDLNRTNMDHPNTELVRYSSIHFIVL